jgi:sarcosine oxidase, subunit gamma
MAELVRLPDPAIVALRCLPDVIGAANAALGIEFPRQTHHFSMRDTLKIAALGPDDWLVIDEKGDTGPIVDALETALKGNHAAIIEMSGNRVCFRLSGSDVGACLARGCSLDIDQMQPGDAAVTIFARAQILLLVESATSVLILPRRSFAAYIEDWFAAARA